MAASVETSTLVEVDGATNGQIPVSKTTNGVNSGLDGKLNPDPNASAPLSTILKPNDLAAVPDLAEKIKNMGGNISSNNDSERRELLAQARHLVQALETPRETMIKHCWAQPGAYMAITFGVNVGLFKTMLANNERCCGADELAPLLGVEATLLARLMRHLAAMGYLSETTACRYQLTEFSKALTIPIMGDGYPCLAGAGRAACDRFPAYAAVNNFAEPTSAEHGAFQYAYDTPLNYFAYIQANDPLGRQFNHHMGGYSRGRPTWMDRFPTQERLIEGAKTGAEDALLVDVGGSFGHDLEAFHAKHPQAPGRLVLQDLPDVLEQIVTLSDKIERQPYDFRTKQPVEGARAYYMHSVLHDWPNDVCVHILDNVKAAMARGYSKLLINENCIPDSGAHWEATALDMMMLTLVSSRERTMEQWRQLVEDQAGLRIVKFWGSMAGVESLIECERP